MYTHMYFALVFDYLRSGVDNSECVERINISFSDAQNQFAHSDDSKDRKDDIFKNRHFSFGYFPRSEYEIICERSLETPSQKFDRLKTEFTEFISMLDKMTSDDASEKPPANAVEMRESAKMLLEQLQEVQLDKITKCEEAVLDPEGSIAKKLTNEITKLTTKSDSSAGSDPTTGGDSGKAKYELYVPSSSSTKSST